MYRETPTVKIKEGVEPSALRFENLGYAAAAIDSSRLFVSLQRGGVIPREWRFQVSLPTPVGTDRCVGQRRRSRGG